MSTSDEPLSAQWQYYAERAEQTHRGRHDDFGLGCEERLDETLKVIQANTPFTNACRECLDRLPQNRAKKHRRLRQLFRKGSPRRARPLSLSPEPRNEEVPLVAHGATLAAGVDCLVCSKPLTAAEHHAYGMRCEDCWVADTSNSGSGLAVANSVELAESVEQVRAKLSPDQWDIERRLAAGETYADVAQGRNVSPDTLKMRVARWRAELRANPAA